MCFVAIAGLRRTFVQVRIPPPAEQNPKQARAVIVDLVVTRRIGGTEKFPQSSMCSLLCLVIPRGALSPAKKERPALLECAVRFAIATD